MTAFLFVQHATAKLFHVPHVAVFDDLQLFSFFGMVGILELVGGLLLLAGLFTRPTAFILSGEMAFAYFIGHAPRGLWPVLNEGSGAILFCFVYLYLSAAGPGPWSLDALLRRGRGELSN